MPAFPDTYSQLLELFYRGEQLTYEQAAARLDVTHRQVQRIISRMRQNGIPVQERKRHQDKPAEPEQHTSPARKGSQSFIFYIDKEHREVGVRVLLTEEQIFALAVAAEAAQATFAPTPLGSPLAEAFAHLLAELPGQVMSFETEEIPAHWHFSSSSSVALNPAIFTAIASAIAECRRLRIDYFTASKGGRWSYGRSIDPYGLAVRNGSWLLVAHCREKQAMREFSLAGIARLEPTEEFFLRPDGFDLETYFGDRFSAVGSTTKYTVRLLVEHDRAAYFHRKVYNRSQRIEQQRDDGSIVVGYTVEGLQEIRSFVQGWGTGVTVLEPEELRAILAREASTLAERYTAK